MGIESSYKDIVREIKPGEVVITFGNQMNGFQYSDIKLSVISDKDIFGQFKKKVNKKKNKKGTGKN